MVQRSELEDALSDTRRLEAQLSDVHGEMEELGRDLARAMEGVSVVTGEAGGLQACFAEASSGLERKVGCLESELRGTIDALRASRAEVCQLEASMLEMVPRSELEDAQLDTRRLDEQLLDVHGEAKGLGRVLGRMIDRLSSTFVGAGGAEACFAEARSGLSDVPGEVLQLAIGLADAFFGVFWAIGEAGAPELLNVEKRWRFDSKLRLLDSLLSSLFSHFNHDRIHLTSFQSDNSSMVSCVNVDSLVSLVDQLPFSFQPILPDHVLPRACPLQYSEEADLLRDQYNYMLLREDSFRDEIDRLILEVDSIFLCVGNHFAIAEAKFQELVLHVQNASLTRKIASTGVIPCNYSQAVSDTYSVSPTGCESEISQITAAAAAEIHRLQVQLEGMVSREELDSLKNETALQAASIASMVHASVVEDLRDELLHLCCEDESIISSSIETISASSETSRRQLILQINKALLCKRQSYPTLHSITQLDSGDCYNPGTTSRDNAGLDMEVVRLRAMMAEMVPAGELVLVKRLLAQREAETDKLAKCLANEKEFQAVLAMRNRAELTELCQEVMSVSAMWVDAVAGLTAKLGHVQAEVLATLDFATEQQAGAVLALGEVARLELAAAEAPSQALVDQRAAWKSGGGSQLRDSVEDIIAAVDLSAALEAAVTRRAEAAGRGSRLHALYSDFSSESCSIFSVISSQASESATASVIAPIRRCSTLSTAECTPHLIAFDGLPSHSLGNSEQEIRALVADVIGKYAGCATDLQARLIETVAIARRFEVLHTAAEAAAAGLRRQLQRLVFALRCCPVSAGRNEQDVQYRERLLASGIDAVLTVDCSSVEDDITGSNDSPNQLSSTSWQRPMQRKRGSQCEATVNPTMSLDESCCGRAEAQILPKGTGEWRESMMEGVGMGAFFV
jgi:hypothetical protein